MPIFVHKLLRNSGLGDFWDDARICILKGIEKAEIQERDGVLCLPYGRAWGTYDNDVILRTLRMVRTFIRLLWNMGATSVHLGEGRNTIETFVLHYLGLSDGPAVNRSGLKIILMYHSVACYFLKLGNEGER